MKTLDQMIAKLSAMRDSVDNEGIKRLADFIYNTIGEKK
jgi:hypothetical protein